MAATEPPGSTCLPFPSSGITSATITPVFFKMWTPGIELGSSCSKVSTLLTESSSQSPLFQNGLYFYHPNQGNRQVELVGTPPSGQLSSLMEAKQQEVTWTPTDHLCFRSDVNKGIQFPLAPRSQQCESWCVILLGCTFPFQKLNTTLLWAEKLECRMTVSQTGWCSECLVKYLGVFFVPSGVGG